MQLIKNPKAEVVENSFRNNIYQLYGKKEKKTLAAKL
jgi:hypothetical protein